MTSASDVTVLLVTHQSAAYLRHAVRSVLDQDHRSLSILAVDNASSDSTVDVLRELLGNESVIALDRNLGYAGGHNLAISRANAPYVLCMNPDVILASGFVAELVAVANQNPAIGPLSGRVMRIPKSVLTGPVDLASWPASQIVDSTGIFPSWLRGEFDRGQGLPLTQVPGVGRRHAIFGVSGCAAFYRRNALEDVAVEGEIFDEDFFMYKEDVDLAWRLQLRGWPCCYVPSAVAFHARSDPRSTPESGGGHPVNRHAMRNRWLLPLKVYPPSLLGWKLILMIGSEVARAPRWSESRWAVPRTMLQAVLKSRRILRKRGHVMRRRTASIAKLLRWLSKDAHDGTIPV